jgi:hypothetical protein
MNSQLRILNDKGNCVLQDYLDELRSGAAQAPQELLVDPGAPQEFLWKYL